MTTHNRSIMGKQTAEPLINQSTSEFIFIECCSVKLLTFMTSYANSSKSIKESSLGVASRVFVYDVVR